MSQQACTEFFAKVNADATLQQEVNTALESKEGTEVANALVWVGAKHGYEFTAEEAAQKYQEIIATATGELDEGALENVAGGAKK
ncbi:Nif11 family protein [Microcoleus sp. T2B6]|uniref:Nif11 family protein n=1 Tax=Microcoleus sp. T2B6 TaxID=3055424 RepID=UPI002FD2DED3